MLKFLQVNKSVDYSGDVFSFLLSSDKFANHTQARILEAIQEDVSKKLSSYIWKKHKHKLIKKVSMSQIVDLCQKQIGKEVVETIGRKLSK